MKLVNDVMTSLKGEGKEKDVLVGKGAFSTAGFGSLVNALANDSTYKVPVFKDGKKVDDVSISELFRSDLKKSVKTAGYPQKSEEAVFDSSEISTAGIATALPYILREWVQTGRKLELPNGKNMVGSIYLREVPASSRTVEVRDPKTQEKLGHVTIENDKYVQLMAKSPTPAHLQKKTRDK